MSETVIFRYHREPIAQPKSGYLVIHNGPIEVGSEVRVITLPAEGLATEHTVGVVTMIDGETATPDPHAE